MSFTIKCNKCGSEQEFTSLSKKYQENISIDVFVKGTYMGDAVDSIEIGCSNPKCDNEIEIKY
jgi:hypothetical protein